MAKTYEQLMRQIEELQSQADKLRRKEAEDVIARIREAIDHYGLTAADLGLAPAAGAGGRGRGKRAGGAARKTRKPAASVAYRGEQPGQTWVGRGKRPQWLRDALAAGRKLEDFKVG